MWVKKKWRRGSAAHAGRETGRRSVAVAVAVLLVAGLASVAPVQAAPGDIGVEGRSFTGTSSPTGAKRSESVVWWNDGLWWAHMWDTVSRDFHIFTLDVATQSWVDTGVPGDTRANTHSDVLWDGTHLYVASHAFVSDGSSAVSGTPSYLFRFSYNAASKTYSQDSGFPVSINNYKTETLAIDKDSTGKLWATWQQGSKIYVNRTTGDDKSWGTPFVLPASGTSVTVDDSSGVIAFGGNKIGVMWSNELTQTVNFAVHEDGQPDATWRPTETASSGPEMADDHINLKAYGGRVFAATKTSMDKPADPLILLLVRDPSSGSWARHTIGTKGDCGNRAIVMIDEENNTLHAFYTQPAPPTFTCQSGGAIYEKTTPLDAISFGSGRGSTVMLDADSAFLHNVASTKQNVNSQTGIALLAVNVQTTRYWHRYLPITPAPRPPVAGFSATPTSGTAPLAVQFTDSSTGSPTGWSWDFGDGGTSTDRNPSHTYQAAGTYTVSLTASNGSGSDTLTRTDYVTATTAPPVAGFSATPTSGTAPLAVQFTDSSTGSPTGWSWDFGDGGTSIDRNPSHTYQVAGTYTVSLTVTNAAGSDTVTQAGLVTVDAATAPVAGFSATPTSGTAPLAVQFTDSSTGSPTGWSWDFGDGGTSIDRNPSHTYQVAGTYTVSLTVTNAAGSDTVTQAGLVTVDAATAPVAGFSATPTSGTAPLAVQFTDSSTGSPTGWSWDFGDGGTSIDRNPSHTYQAAGTYTVSLTVTNAAGSDTFTRTDYVTATTAPPVAGFSATPTSGTAPLAVQFTDSSTGSPTGWSWDFGDGGTSTDRNPSHTYQAAGTYTVTLTATNAGGSNTLTRDALVTVTNAPDTVKPTVSMAFPTAGATVSGTVDLVANASDLGGVVKVEWWLDGVRVATDRDGEPWSKPWNSATVSLGSHKIFAKAQDTAGNYGSSVAVTFTVAQAEDTTPPVVSITAPAVGASVSGSTDVEATASDGVGVVAVRWKVDGTEVAADTNGAPWSASWDTTTVADGSHTVVAVASDAAGNEGTSASVGFMVSNAAGPGLLFSDGFESGDFSAWTMTRTGADGTATVQSESAKTGTFAAALSATANTGSFAYARRTLSPRTELTVAGDFQVTQEGASGGNVPLFRLFDSSGARIISVARQNLDANKVRVTHGGSSATTTGRLAVNAWGHIELHVIVSAAGSTVEVSVDGVLAYRSTTADLGTDNIATIQIGNETAKQTFRLNADNIEVGP